MATDKVQIGVIGTGNILSQYVRGTRAFEILDLVACAEIDVPKAKARADEFDIPRACTVDELLADPEMKGLADEELARLDRWQPHGILRVDGFAGGDGVVEQPAVQ